MGRPTVSQAARTVTRPATTHAFAPDEFLNMLSLDGAPAGQTSTLGEGKWDKATGGAIAVRSQFSVDKNGRLASLSCKYLALNPAGDSTDSKLVELETRAQGDKIKIHKMWVLGRPVDLRTPGAANRVLGFLQQMHSDIRNLQMPDIGKSFTDFQISGLMGERMHLPGLSREGGVDFKPIIGAKPRAEQEVRVPAEYLPELLGCGTNDLDPHLRLGAERRQIGTDQQNGSAFRYHNKLSGTMDAAQMQADIAPLSPADKPIPDFARLQWRKEGADAVIESFSLFGDNNRYAPIQHYHKRLGALNAINADLRHGKYPSIASHFAEFHQQDLIDRRAFVGDAGDNPKMIVKVYGGHNAREYLPGFGGTIGGNSKGILVYSRDADGQQHVTGVRIDAGSTFSKQGGILAGAHGTWNRAIPNPGDDLAFLKHDFITHLHADHMQALVDETRAGRQVGRTIHAAEYDIRVLREFLKKEKIARDLWPEMDELNGEGCVHLDNGKDRVLTVYYSTNAIPHSTPVTAFITAPPPYKCDKNGKAYPSEELKINPNYWSYASLGDMSFGPFNLPGYQGEKPPDTGFKRGLFADFKQRMAHEYPDMTPAMRKRVDVINVAETDPTSVHREGFAPDVVRFEKNLETVSGDWFKELGILFYQLSTGKRQEEAVFRVAVKTGRNLSGEGAFVENRLRDMNVMGVNTDVIPRNQEGGNNNAYLRWYAEKIEKPAVKFFGRMAGAWHDLVRTSPEKTFIFASGSQGTDIEKDSVGTQVAEGHSRFHLDPKYCRSAYGIDPKKFVHLYGQSAIPGNEDKQLAQVSKMAFENDLMVGVAVHDGARFYNLKEPFLSRIEQYCDDKGIKYTSQENGGLLVHGFSLYPPGHGWKEDYRQGFLPWMKENNVDMISVQHYPRVESVYIMHGLADEKGLRHPPEPVPNHVAWTIENGRDFKILGQFTPAFTFVRENRRFGKYHGGSTEFLDAIFPSSEGGLSHSGLFAADNAVYFNKFGQSDYEQVHYEATLTPLRSLRDPERAFTEQPPDLGVSRLVPTRGMASPRPLRAHAHLEGC